MNLNNLKINEKYDMCEQTDFSEIGNDKQIEVYFKNIENHIIQKIKKYNNVVGCVAWLTNSNILNELSKKKSVIIIIQEEDFLRPDTYFDGQKEKWKNKIHELYSKIEKLDDIYLGCIGINTRGLIESGIRRVGLINKDNSPAFPRMHNKFIICFDEPFTEYFTPDYEDRQKIYGEVLTGSYNYTENSNNSLENVVCIKEQSITASYFLQFCEICMMSIPLDWDLEWSSKGTGEIFYGS